MAYNARVEYVATGGTDFTFPFSYLDPAFVKATVDEVPVSITLPSGGTARITPAPAAGAEVAIYRQSGAMGQLLVNFKNDRALSGDALNTSYRHSLHRTEEALDDLARVEESAVEAAREAAVAVSRAVPINLAADVGKVLKAKGSGIYAWEVNAFEAPVNPEDGVPKQYLDDAIATREPTLGFTPVDRAGDNMSGPLSVPSLTVDGVPSPTLPVGASVEWNGSTLPPGFLWEDGANYSRVTYAKLFAVIGTSFGAGDGSATFAVPDSRGRVAVGRDNMGGTAAARLTSGVAGLSGDTLGAAGGDQRLHSHGHGVTDPGHGHGVADPGHSHSINDPGHNHWFRERVEMYAASLTGGGAGLWVGEGNGSTGWVGTNITINGAATGIGIHGALTSISVQAAGGGASQNVQPSIIKNKIIFAGV